MSVLFDEGFTDDDWHAPFGANHSDCIRPNEPEWDGLLRTAGSSVQDCEELAYRLLASLPRSRLATVQRRIAPLLQFDVVGSLPTEVALQLFTHLPAQTLLQCALVSRRWRTLADDQFLWKNLCDARGWEWRQPSRAQGFEAMLAQARQSWDDSDDEGMGDSDEEGGNHHVGDDEFDGGDMAQNPDDSGFASTSMSIHTNLLNVSASSSFRPIRPQKRSRALARHSAPSILPSHGFTSTLPKPNYKLLYQTHVRLHNRFLSASYRLSALQTRGAPTNTHTNTIYCLQLYTYSSTGVQVLFTGSRDRSIREWNLSTGLVERVISGVHESSVLSICVWNGLIASAGSDRRVAVWDLTRNALVKVICDHEDSVLCVRFDDERLVSCSKDRTVRTYKFPDLNPQFVLGAHRAAVNAVSISKTLIVSGSGDRSIRLWDAQTGALLRTFENHHTRGIASIDFRPPYVLSGSSDKHLRLFDITSLQGWSTSPEYEGTLQPSSPFPFPLPLNEEKCAMCQACRKVNNGPRSAGGRVGGEKCVHGDLVRSVALGEDFVLSGSYDLSVKVWDRNTGALVVDLTGGHTGRIFCIGFDCTKIVSCGEDQRICLWDFSHGIDTSFVKL